LDELITILVMGKEPGLSERVVEALLNNETYFFRDRTPFDLIARHALPQLAQRRQPNRRLRIWSAGCSTGQEAYSLAMLFAEDPAQWQGWTIDILASDVSSGVVERARKGIFTQFEVQRGLAINQTIRWFEEVEDGWRAIQELRKPVRFQVHNLLEAPPNPGEFDIVLCRNVLLYLAAEKRTLAFDRLASAVAADGWLMLGAGETVIGQTSRFGADPEARGLYRRNDGEVTVEKRSADRRAAGKA
jgi:chemotaxis protein methyltransferase CheR